jgi:4-alpha-glucanotransferase
VLYQAIHDERNAPWWRWPKGLRSRESKALAQAASARRAIDYLIWEQFAFFRQWQALHDHAAERGVCCSATCPSSSPTTAPRSGRGRRTSI